MIAPRCRIGAGWAVADAAAQGVRYGNVRGGNHTVGTGPARKGVAGSGGIIQADGRGIDIIRRGVARNAAAVQSIRDGVALLCCGGNGIEGIVQVRCKGIRVCDGAVHLRKRLIRLGIGHAEGAPCAVGIVQIQAHGVGTADRVDAQMRERFQRVLHRGAEVRFIVVRGDQVDKAVVESPVVGAGGILFGAEKAVHHVGVNAALCAVRQKRSGPRACVLQTLVSVIVRIGSAVGTLTGDHVVFGIIKIAAGTGAVVRAGGDIGGAAAGVIRYVPEIPCAALIVRSHQTDGEVRDILQIRIAGGIYGEQALRAGMQNGKHVVFTLLFIPIVKALHVIIAAFGIARIAPAVSAFVVEIGHLKMYGVGAGTGKGAVPARSAGVGTRPVARAHCRGFGGYGRAADIGSGALGCESRKTAVGGIFGVIAAVVVVADAAGIDALHTHDPAHGLREMVVAVGIVYLVKTAHGHGIGLIHVGIGVSFFRNAVRRVGIAQRPADIATRGGRAQRGRGARGDIHTAAV